MSGARRRELIDYHATLLRVRSQAARKLARHRALVRPVEEALTTAAEAVRRALEPDPTVPVKTEDPGKAAGGSS